MDHVAFARVPIRFHPDHFALVISCSISRATPLNFFTSNRSNASSGDDAIVVAVAKIQRLEPANKATSTSTSPLQKLAPEDVLRHYISDLHWERQRAMDKFHEERLRHLTMLHEEFIAVLHALRERWSCEAIAEGNRRTLRGRD